MNPLRIAQLEEVGFKWALQRHTKMRSWGERFAQLADYKKEHGHCNVPIRYKINPSLGQWVSTQRQEYSNFQNGKKSNMSTERITKLEEAEFCWSLRDTAKMAPRKSWDMHFAALVEFKKIHGHCDVRVRSKQAPSGSLGRWVEKQRSQYHSRNEGKESKITQEQIDQLDSIGFRWRIRHERNKISGCPRNPDLKLDDEAMLDEYTKRAIENQKQMQDVITQEQNVTYKMDAESHQMMVTQEIVAIQMDIDHQTVESTTAESVSMAAAAVAAVEQTAVHDSIPAHVPVVPAPESLSVTAESMSDPLVISTDHISGHGPVPTPLAVVQDSEHLAITQKETMNDESMTYVFKI
jgi:hypothetical protein